MPFTIRLYSPTDFELLHAIDTACYPSGIAYSRRTLKWFLMQPGAECLVAVEAEAPGRSSQQSARSANKKVEAAVRPDPNIIGFIIAQANAPEAHIITLDVREQHRRAGAGSALLAQTEQRLAARGVRYAVLETATSNEAAVAFWNRHGYRSVGVLRHYYLNRIDAYVMQKVLAGEGFEPTMESR